MQADWNESYPELMLAVIALMLSQVCLRAQYQKADPIQHSPTSNWLSLTGAPIPFALLSYKVLIQSTATCTSRRRQVVIILELDIVLEEDLNVMLCKNDFFHIKNRKTQPFFLVSTRERLVDATV